MHARWMGPVLLLAGCAGTETPEPVEPTEPTPMEVVFTSSQHGELEPCG